MVKNKTVFLGSLLVSLIAFGLTNPPAIGQTKSRVFYEKHGEQNYVIYYINSQGKINFKLEFPKKPFIIRHPNNLIEFGVSTGSPGRNSWFVDLKADRITKRSFFEVLAVEPYKYLVAEAGEEGTKGIYISSIFSAEKPLLKLENFSFEILFDYGVEEAKFIDKGQRFYIRYNKMVNGKLQLKEETFKI